MTWSYTGDPAASAKDEIRFLIGDTDSNSQLLSDEEIAHLVTNQSSTLLAAADAADVIAAQFSRKADTEIDNTKIMLSQRAEGYRKLATSLRDRGGGGGAAGVYPHPSSPGQSIDLSDDVELVKPTISRGMHDHP